MKQFIFNKWWDICEQYVQNDLNKKCNNTLQFKRNAKNDVYQIYQEQNELLHTWMCYKDGNIDRHKVASLFCYALLKSRPLIQTNDITKTLYNRFANEYLALYMSFSIVRSFILAIDTYSHPLQENVHFNNNSFQYPPYNTQGNHKNNSYTMYLLKLLHYSKESNNYNILMFSNILFLIEEYTIQYYKLVDISL